MTLMLSLLNPIRKLPSKLTFMMFALFCGAFLFLNSIVKLQLFFKKKKMYIFASLLFTLHRSNCAHQVWH